MKPSDRAWLLPFAALALIAGILVGRETPCLLPGIAALICALPAALLLHGRMRMAAVLLAVMSLGCIRASIVWHQSLPPEGTYTVSGIISEEIRLRDDGQVRTYLRHLTLNNEPVSGAAYWSFYLREDEHLPSDLHPGRRVTLQASVYHPRGADNPGGYNFREYLLQQGALLGIYGRTDLTTSTGGLHPAALGAAVRSRLTQRLTAVLGEDTGSYAATMILGARHLIPDEDRDAFSRLGIAHFLSISGYHTGVLAFVAARLLKRLQLHLRLRTAITAGVLALYCLLTGANPPVIRASILAILMLCGRIRHRQNLPLHLLSLAAIIMLLISPAQLTSASFQLSYGAMLGIALISPVLNKRYLVSHRSLSKGYQVFSISISAQIGILLPQLYWFHELPLFSLPINMLFTAGITLMMGFFWFFLLMLPLGPLAAVIGMFASPLIEALLSLIRFCGQAPFLTLWTKQANLLTLAGWILLLWSLSFFRTRKRRIPIAAGILFLCLSLVPLPEESTTYIQLSAGNADAALIRDHNTTMAIDAGSDTELADYLHARRLSLDALILTHLHMDHAGGVEALLEKQIPVHRLLMPEGALTASIAPEITGLIDRLVRRGTEVVTLSRGDEILLPSGRIRVLWPEHGKTRPQQDPNIYCAVLRAELRGTSLLLTGDIDSAYEHYVSAPADILKIAHHGSADGTGKDFLHAVKPHTLLLSCGNQEREELTRQRMSDIPLYSTHSSGAITIEFSDQEYTVRTLR